MSHEHCFIPKKPAPYEKPLKARPIVTKNTPMYGLPSVTYIKATTADAGTKKPLFKKYFIKILLLKIRLNQSEVIEN
jgi:hypothetical protein